ncbi:MAG: hypothetical protein Q9164_004825 [Protoblastenia rupestris]
MASTGDAGSLLGNLILAHDSDLSIVEIEKRKRSALQTIENNSSRRINQFEVSAVLKGLVEKLRILNKDGLADTLQSRVEELAGHPDQWTPEVLSLFLQLSDRPTHKTKVEDLAILRSDVPATPLQWSEINAESSLDDDSAIWENVDFANDGSDEENDMECIVSGGSDDDQKHSTPSIEDVDSRIQELKMPVESNDTNDLFIHRFWQTEVDVNGSCNTERTDGARDQLLLTELQLVREVIFMLLGLPTMIYTRALDATYKLSRFVLINHVSSDSVISHLKNFAIVGEQLERVRTFANKKEQVPLVQTFQATLGQRLHIVHCMLDVIQAKILDHREDLSVSLLGLYEEVSHGTRLIRQLDGVLQDANRSLEPQRPFRILECLFEKACFCHSIADLEAYDYVASIFFECFQTYLKPIRLWMETGHLSKHDQMFVKCNVLTTVSLESLWQDQFSLTYVDDGTLYAPKFMHLAAKRIFNTGKSVDFLKRLGYEETALISRRQDHTNMSFGTVCQAADQSMLSPFPELFESAFESWIESMYSFPSSFLRDRLEKQCGLGRCLDALEHIYFLKSSALTSTILTPIFERIESGKRTWNDSFFVCKLLQGAFTTASCIDVTRIGVRHTTSTHQGKQPIQRSMSLLEDLSITYTLPWPIANIIRTNNLLKYQHIFVLLAQLHRAKYLLQHHKPPKSGHPNLSKGQLHQIYSLRTRLLYFVNSMLTHLTALVLEPRTMSMRAEMARAEDVDAMTSVHARYTDEIEEKCLLSRNHASLKQAVVSILDLTVLFADVLAKPENGDTMRGSQTKIISKRSSLSSSEDEDEGRYESPSARLPARVTPVAPIEIGRDEKLNKIQDNLRQLLSFITATAQRLSKSDDAACWEILASNLTAGLI